MSVPVSDQQTPSGQKALRFSPGNEVMPHVQDVAKACHFVIYLFTVDSLKLEKKRKKKVRNMENSY